LLLLNELFLIPEDGLLVLRLGQQNITLLHCKNLSVETLCTTKHPTKAKEHKTHNNRSKDPENYEAAARHLLPNLL
jgi:hypothetical protein